jgi:hypothetical protein
MHCRPISRHRTGGLRLGGQHLEKGLPMAELSADAAFRLRCAYYHWLPRTSRYITRIRKLSALGWRSPQQWLNELLR